MTTVAVRAVQVSLRKYPLMTKKERAHSVMVGGVLYYEGRIFPEVLTQPCRVARVRLVSPMTAFVDIMMRRDGKVWVVNRHHPHKGGGRTCTELNMEWTEAVRTVVYSARRCGRFGDVRMVKSCLPG